MSPETHMYEADLKGLQVKIVALEQDLIIAQNEKKKLEIETNSLIEKHKSEIRVSRRPEANESAVTWLATWTPF